MDMFGRHWVRQMGGIVPVNSEQSNKQWIDRIDTPWWWRWRVGVCVILILAGVSSFYFTRPWWIDPALDNTDATLLEIHVNGQPPSDKEFRVAKESQLVVSCAVEFDKNKWRPIEKSDDPLSVTDRKKPPFVLSVHCVSVGAFNSSLTQHSGGEQGVGKLVEGIGHFDVVVGAPHSPDTYELRILSTYWLNRDSFRWRPIGRFRLKIE